MRHKNAHNLRQIFVSLYGDECIKYINDVLMSYEMGFIGILATRASLHQICKNWIF